jgi:leader peptidase (prepilin peptidase)/N-methyltransferase
MIVLLGPAIGSFIGVLADRLPRGESLWRPSACRACGHRLRAAEMVPLVSYLFQRGRARCCGAPLPPWLPSAEIAAALIGVLVVLAVSGPLAQILTAAVLWCLLALAVTDILWFRLPDPLTASLAMLAAAAPPISGMGWIMALTGAAAGGASFLALRWGYQALRDREGLGLGDVKLMVGAGALVGPIDLPSVVLLAAVAALAAAFAGQLSGGGRMTATRALPFGAALSAATGCIWVFLTMQAGAS